MSVPSGFSVFVMEIHVVHNNMQFNFATNCKILCLLFNLCSDVLVWIKGLKFVRCFNLDSFVLMFKSYFDILFCGNLFDVNLNHVIAFLFPRIWIICRLGKFSRFYVFLSGLQVQLTHSSNLYIYAVQPITFYILVARNLVSLHVKDCKSHKLS